MQRAMDIDQGGGRRAKVERRLKVAYVKKEGKSKRIRSKEENRRPSVDM